MSTDKRDEALKKSLEYLDFFDPPCANSIRKILAQSRSDEEQPAQPIKQGWDVDDLLDKPKHPAQQQEPNYSICPTCGGMASDPIVPPSDRLTSKPWVHVTTWRGLTDEEIEQCMKQAYATVQGRNLEQAFARAIEAKLKEKNGF